MWQFQQHGGSPGIANVHVLTQVKQPFHVRPANGSLFSRRFFVFKSPLSLSLSLSRFIFDVLLFFACCLLDLLFSPCFPRTRRSAGFLFFWAVVASARSCLLCWARVPGRPPFFKQKKRMRGNNVRGVADKAMTRGETGKGE